MMLPVFVYLVRFLRGYRQQTHQSDPCTHCGVQSGTLMTIDNNKAGGSVILKHYLSVGVQNKYRVCSRMSEKMFINC